MRTKEVKPIELVEAARPWTTHEDPPSIAKACGLPLPGQPDWCLSVTEKNKRNDFLESRYLSTRMHGFVEDHFQRRLAIKPSGGVGRRRELLFVKLCKMLERSVNKSVTRGGAFLYFVIGF